MPTEDGTRTRREIDKGTGKRAPGMEVACRHETESHEAELAGGMQCAGPGDMAPSLASLRDAWLAFADPEVGARLRPPALFCHPCGMEIDKGTGKIAPGMEVACRHETEPHEAELAGGMPVRRTGWHGPVSGIPAGCMAGVRGSGGRRKAPTSGFVLPSLRDGGRMPTRIDKGTGKIAPPALLPGRSDTRPRREAKEHRVGTATKCLTLCALRLWHPCGMVLLSLRDGGGMPTRGGTRTRRNPLGACGAPDPPSVGWREYAKRAASKWFRWFLLPGASGKP